MKERLQGRLWRSVASVATLVNRPLFRWLAREANASDIAAPNEIAAHMLRKMNIKTRYVQEESNPDFKEWRRRLNEDPGIIICNHPLRLEVLSLLAMITRKDVKAIASKMTVDMAAPVFGNDYFIQVDPEAGRTEIQKGFSEAENHIKKGGLLILFPTGSSQRDPSASFRGGFRTLLKQALSPSDMIYACKVNMVDVERLRKERTKRMLGLLVPRAEQKNLFSEFELRMDERYTKAGEWPALLGQSPAEDNRALTAHYESLFTQD